MWKPLSNYSFMGKLIIAIAGEKWRHERPGRECPAVKNDPSLVSGISDSGNSRVLPFGSDEQGSYRGKSSSRSEDDFASAAQIIDDTLLAVRDNAQFPGRINCSAVLPMFDAAVGKTLRSEESMVLGRDEMPRNLMQRLESDYCPGF